MNKERIIKLIWDFRGIDANKTAEHHAIHLQQYKVKHDIGHTTGYEHVNEFYSIAFFAVKESDMISVRDALIPQRGELFED